MTPSNVFMLWRSSLMLNVGAVWALNGGAVWALNGGAVWALMVGQYGH
jgi:hypothetical protein